MSQDCVRFLADWSVARPCERNRVLLGPVVPSFCVQLNVLYFFPLSLSGWRGSGLLGCKSTGENNLNMLVTFGMDGRDRFMGASFMPSCMLMM